MEGAGGEKVGIYLSKTCTCMKFSNNELKKNSITDHTKTKRKFSVVLSFYEMLHNILKVNYLKEVYLCILKI